MLKTVAQFANDSILEPLSQNRELHPDCLEQLREKFSLMPFHGDSLDVNEALIKT